MRRLLLVAVSVCCYAYHSSAGVYSPDEPCPFPVKPDGIATALPFKLFQILSADVFAGLVPLDPANPGTLDWYPAEDGTTLRVGPAGIVAQRLAARWPVRNEITDSELAGFTSDLLRLGGSVQVIERLQPELRSRQPNYLLISNLAHAYASAGDWRTALTRFSDALDCDPPKVLPGTATDRLKWQLDVDRKYYRQWLRIRREEAEKRPGIEIQEPDAVFVTADGKPIRFWESNTEAAKLPPDAVAVAQQLFLWAPWDVKLLWLVAEVYLAKGDVREADAIFYQCSNARKFGGPILFRDHAGKARDAVAILPPPQEIPIALPEVTETPLPEQPPDGERGIFAMVDRTTFYVVVGVFAVASMLLITLQLRSIARRIGRPSR